MMLFSLSDLKMVTKKWCLSVTLFCALVLIQEIVDSGMGFFSKFTEFSKLNGSKCQFGQLFFNVKSHLDPHTFVLLLATLKCFKYHTHKLPVYTYEDRYLSF